VGIVRCDQVRDILGLWGDTSDNIPGVPGIGEKTAQKLIAQYDSLENVLDHAAEQKGKLREALEKFRDQAILSKRLATIDTEVPLPFEPEVLRIGPRDEPALRVLFTELEFNTLGRRLFGDSFKAGRGSAVAASQESVAGPATRRESHSKEISRPELVEGSVPPASLQHPPIPPFPSRSAPSTT